MLRPRPSTPLRPWLVLPWLALLAAFAPATVCADEEAEEARAKLEQLRDRIEAVREDLAAKRERRDEVSDELARIEQRIGRLAGELAELDRRMRSNRDRLAALGDRRAQVREQLSEHRATLAAQLRAAYRLGRQPALRLLLRQEEPGAVARALGYYGYLNDARLDAIERARALIDELAVIERKAEQTRSALGEDQARLEQQRAALEDARAERRAVVARLDESIDAKGDRLERLQASRARLEELLDRLETVIGELPAAPLEERPFSSRRGQLAWPVEGALRARFGNQRSGGRLRWNGMVVEAAAGTQVRAVYYGRVVFADWLSGFGQLLIIDHLDGYMSLYGFNRRLLRGTGEWVAPGEPVATVGSSGGRSEPSLYFEIRHDGQPVDPGRWLAAR